MRYLSFLFIWIIFVASAASVNAQLYEYRDSQGNLRYTDDFGNVPLDQRETVKRIRDIPSSPPPSAWQEPETYPDDMIWDMNEEDDSAPGPEVNQTELFEKGEALQQEQTLLQEEYARLMEERNLLAESPGEDAPDDELNAYAKAVEEINSRIKDYQARLQDHENRVREYNAQFRE